MTLKQEGRIEREAVVGLTKASAQGRCGDSIDGDSSCRAPRGERAARDDPPGLAATAGNTPAAPMSGTARSTPLRHNRRGSQGKAGSSTTDQQPPAASAGIAPPQHGGFNWLLLALLIALGLAALWLVLSRLRSQPEAVRWRRQRDDGRRPRLSERPESWTTEGRSGGPGERDWLGGVAEVGLCPPWGRRARATRKRSTRLEDAPPAPRAPRAQDAPAVPLTQNKPAALPAQTEPAAPAPTREPRSRLGSRPSSSVQRSPRRVT